MLGIGRKSPAIAIDRLASLIAEDVEITGDVVFARGMRIDGKVRGKVIGRDDDAASLLVVSTSGSVDGCVRCGNAVIDGAVRGELNVADHLVLQSNARVSGTLRYRQLRMDVGACVEGELIRVEPAAEPVAPRALELSAERS